jgi:hypothetical protein
MDNVLITIYGTQKKTTTNIGEEKSTITEIQNNPPVRLHITGTKKNREFLNTNVNK